MDRVQVQLSPYWRIDASPQFTKIGHVQFGAVELILLNVKDISAHDTACAAELRMYLCACII